MTARGTFPAFPSGLPEEGGGGASRNRTAPAIPAPTMTTNGLTPIQKSAAAAAARTRFDGFFPMSRPKVNVAFATMATTIT